MLCAIRDFTEVLQVFLFAVLIIFSLHLGCCLLINLYHVGFSFTSLFCFTVSFLVYIEIRHLQCLKHFIASYFNIPAVLGGEKVVDVIWAIKSMVRWYR